MTREALAWATAAVAVVAAVAGFARPVGAPPLKTAVGDATSKEQELGVLRRRVLTMQSEESALRSELDRLRRLVELKKASDAREAASGAAEVPRDERQRRAVEALARVDGVMAEIQADPTEEKYRSLQGILLDLFHAPMDDAGPFEERYAAATDPLTKAFLLPHVAARQGDKIAEFVSHELQQNRDPGVRADLIAQLRVHASPEKDEAARAIFLSALTTESDPRARQMAVEALADVRRPEVEQALLAAAGQDADERTRELAVRQLAGNPETRSRVLDMLAKDSNENLRTIGECAAKLATAGGAG